MREKTARRELCRIRKTSSQRFEYDSRTSEFDSAKSDVFCRTEKRPPLYFGKKVKVNFSYKFKKSMKIRKEDELRLINFEELKKEVR